MYKFGIAADIAVQNQLTQESGTKGAVQTEFIPSLTVDWTYQNMHRQTLQTSRGSMALEPF